MACSLNGSLVNMRPRQAKSRVFDSINLDRFKYSVERVVSEKMTFQPLRRNKSKAGTQNISQDFKRGCSDKDDEVILTESGEYGFSRHPLTAHSRASFGTSINILKQRSKLAGAPSNFETSKNPILYAPI